MTVSHLSHAATSAANQLDLSQNGKLPICGQFFSLSRQFTSNEIAEVLASLKLGLCGLALPLGTKDWYCIQQAENGTLNGIGWGAKTSALVAEFSGAPTFLDASNPIERRYGYVILMEIELDIGNSKPNYLFVQRLHIGDPCVAEVASGTKPACTPLGFETFLEPFTDKGTRIESIAMRPMGISRLDLRRKVLDSHDVQATISSLGLNRIVHGALRVVQEGGSTSNRRLSLSPRQRKLKQAGDKLSLSDLAQWAAGIAIEFDKAKAVANLTSSFLRSFAKPTITLAGATAQSVLIDTAVLRELLDVGNGAYQIVDMAKAADVSPRSSVIFDALLTAMDDAIHLKPVVGAPQRFVGAIANAKPVEVHVDVRSRTCTLSLKNCDWGVKPNAHAGAITAPIPLGRFINEKKAFRVALNNGTMLYCSEGAFSDGDISQSAKLLLNIIRPMAAALNPVVTEKGNPVQGATTFDPTSSFYVIENTLSASHPWLLCDDSNNEWCDFMSLRLPTPLATGPSEVRWYHAKVNRRKDQNGNYIPMGLTKGAVSATGLQEVVGQAIKNLGRIRMQSKHSDVKERSKFWKTDYVWPDATRTASSMPRLKFMVGGATTRTPASVSNFLKDYETALSNPHTLFEVALVVPNYKKITLENAFKRLGSKYASQTATQIFWLLSGFMHSCLEIGVRPVIYTR